MFLSFKRVLMAAAAVTLCSCGPQVVPSSGPRPPLSPNAVNIYQQKPHRYEDLGSITLQITPEIGWDQNGDANKAFDIFKAKAAALGANGILLDIDPGPNGIMTEAGYHGTYYHVPTLGKVALGEAIYVLKE